MNNKELIKKHLERWQGLEVASIEHYANTGKISGFLYLAIEKMLDEKSKEAVNELVKTLESIKTAAEGVHTPEEAAAVLHFIRNKSFKALSETYKQSK